MLGHRVAYGELSNIYEKETGKNARSLPLERIVDWAETRKDLFFVTEDGTIFHKDGEK